MNKVICICGKICSGKSCYAKQLKQSQGGVILSTDEATYMLINNEQGEFYNVFAARVNVYLMKKAAEIAQAGADVILDWGFWSREDSSRASRYFSEHGVPCEWHYIDIDDISWQRNITERNNRILSGSGGSDFFVDEGLLKKLLELFEPPTESEIDVTIKVKR